MAWKPSGNRADQRGSPPEAERMTKQGATLTGTLAMVENGRRIPRTLTEPTKNPKLMGKTKHKSQMEKNH